MPASRSRFWLLPAATFLVGLVLGGLLLWVGDVAGGPGGADDDEAGGTPAATATASPDPTSSDLTVTVPRSCLEAIELSEEIITLARQATGAIGELNALTLQRTVDELQDIEPRLRETGADCRSLRS